MANPVTASPISFTKDPDVVSNMAREIGYAIYLLKGYTMISGEENDKGLKGGIQTSMTRDIKGLDDKQPYLVICYYSDPTAIKAYLTANNILKSENSDYSVIELHGKKCPLIFHKSIIQQQ